MQRLFTRREKVILSIIIALAVFSVFFNFFIAPILKKNSTLNKEISITRTKLKKYLWLVSKKEQIQEKYGKLAMDLKLPGKGEDASVTALSALESLAQSANIRIIDIRPQVSTKSIGLYKESIVDIRVEGEMRNYLEFIFNLENSFTLLRIKRFQLSAKPNSQFLEGSFSISQISTAD